MREKIKWNEGWRFHQGDISVPEQVYKGASYMQAKTERAKIGPASWHYNDGVDSYENEGTLPSENWEWVKLPHDYIIQQVPEKKNNNALGYFLYENAWYRKHFTLSEEDRGKRLFVYFEAAAIQAVVYVNGCLVKRNFCGYTSFEADITDFVVYDKENVIAVYVYAASGHEGWWYEGAGIYRPVWLVKTDPVYVDLWGVYIRPVCEEGTENWDTRIEVTAVNAEQKEACVEIENILLNPEGNQIDAISGKLTVGAGEKAVSKTSILISNPHLWDVSDPSQYIVITRINRNGEVLDEVKNRFGYRHIRFDANEGFFLNGRHVLIQGVCCHQDYGLTGKAVPERVQKYRLELLKEMGVNGLRTSHYPNSEYTMDALDEMGFLVMDETRWFSSSEEGKAQLEMMVKRDRNRPSVILWSIANEEPLSLTEAGQKIARTLKAFVKTMDPDRPVTAAISHDPLHAPAAGELDVIGINYNLDQYDAIHEKYPDVPIVSSECCATGTTRGWYLQDDAARGYIYGYDRDTNNWFRGRERTWKFLKERPYVMGCFQWAGIEHRGETVWPRLCSQSGAIDLYLQRKDAFYQNKSHWTEEPMIHLLPHWNWEGREGQKILVYAYTNCSEVELFLNGRSLGRKQVVACGHGEWRVPYEAGALMAKGYRNGVCMAEDHQETTGKPAALKLRIEAGEEILANGEDVAILTCYCVDKEGREVPDASMEVSFYTEGPGSIAATGSDVCDHVPPAWPNRGMRAGKCSVLVRAGSEPGEIAVFARAEGMEMTEVVIRSVKMSRPSDDRKKI